MRFISTRAHGALDYLMGLLLIVSPWLFGFAEGGAETWVPVIVGASALLYSLLTNYEMGFLSHTIPMSTHLWLDALSGVFLAASPWLFGFAEFVWVPHVVFGLLEIGASLFTHTTPDWHGAHGTHAGAHGTHHTAHGI